MNPMNLIKQYMLKGFTPKGMLNQLSKNNPILGNIINMAEKGDTEGVENFARNVCKQRGLDFDTEFNKFRNNLR